MKLFAGLDISLRDTHICIVDEDGKVIRETRVLTEPDDICRSLSAFKKALARVGFEASSLSPWLSGALKKANFPATVVEARHMASALGAMRNKTDRNDAKGIAQMMRTGWFREVHVKSDDSHKLRLLLANRRMLKRKFIDIENTIRGTLKVFGIKTGHLSRAKFDSELRDLLHSEDAFLQEMIDPMLQARMALLVQFTRCETLIVRAARENPVCRRFMTIPGVGPMTAIAVFSGIDDPRRFTSSKTVGAYFGMTPKRFQSGTVDNEGRISRCGDNEVRTLLFEAGTSILCRVQKWSALKAWGLKIQRRSGFKCASVAVGRKLAVIMHRMWIDGTEFQYSSQNAASQAA